MGKRKRPQPVMLHPPHTRLDLSSEKGPICSILPDTRSTIQTGPIRLSARRGVRNETLLAGTARLPVTAFPLQIQKLTRGQSHPTVAQAAVDGYQHTILTVYALGQPQAALVVQRQRHHLTVDQGGMAAACSDQPFEIGKQLQILRIAPQHRVPGLLAVMALGPRLAQADLGAVVEDGRTTEGEQERASHA